MESYQRYIKSIDKIPLISTDEEQRLSKVIHNSNDSSEIKKAINVLAISNLRLVISRAIKFSRRFQSIDLMTLISDGNLALFKAAQRFKPDSGATFGTYAVSCIDKCFYQTVVSNDIIRVPTDQNDKICKLSKAQSFQENKLSDEEIMQILDIKQGSLDLLKNAKQTRHVRSLDAVITSDENSVSLLDLIPDESVKPVDHNADLTSIREYLEGKMDTFLSKREKEMLHIVYFEGGSFSYADISKRMGVSRERCRQILAMALRRLRKCLVKSPLKYEMKG